LAKDGETKNAVYGERFKDSRAVCRGMKEKYRLLPRVLRYVESWVEADYRAIGGDDNSLSPIHASLPNK